MPSRYWYFLRLECFKFAEKVKPTNIYHEFQSNGDFILRQIAWGKFGEWLIAFELDLLGECSEPDMKIYAAKKKSFDADLTLNGVDVHCKTTTVTSAKRWGESWCFKAQDPLLKNPEGFISLCTIDTEKEMAKTYGPFEAKLIVPLLEEPKAPNQKGKVRILNRSKLPL